VTETRIGRKHGRHRSRQEADQLAAEYEASGLTREEFCVQRNVPLKSLCRYVSRYRKERTSNQQGPRLLPVEVMGTGGDGVALTVVLAHRRRIEVKPGFDGGTLRQLMAVLEQI
jgi:hypothetical protein